MFKSKQPNNGNNHIHSRSGFIKNVLIGAFFPTPITNDQIKEMHNSAVETHIKAKELHDQIEQKIEETNKLLMKQY